MSLWPLCLIASDGGTSPHPPQCCTVAPTLSLGLAAMNTSYSCRNIASATPTL